MREHQLVPILGYSSPYNVEYTICCAHCSEHAIQRQSVAIAVCFGGAGASDA
ncbi:hypothetical protein RSAG8_07148, partial [Rhizoctonia solani AG-8 WAC10335]